MELVIIVVIIGILASLALPRYHKAIEKSRTTEALNMLGAIRQSQIRYALEDDVYAVILSDLDIYSSVSGRFFDYDVIGGANPNDAIDQRIARAQRTSYQIGSYNQYNIYINESGAFESDNIEINNGLPR